MGTKFAVVYGASSNVIHRIISCENDRNDDHIEVTRKNMSSSEALIVFDIADHAVRNAAAMQRHIGVPAHGGRCALVDGSGTVVDVISADPVDGTEKHPSGHRVVLHPTANVGDKIT